MADQPIITQRCPCVLEVGPGTIYWCRCGRSRTEPFCDGSHTGKDLSPMDVYFEEMKGVALCGCKQTKKPPFCDGSHARM